MPLSETQFSTFQTRFLVVMKPNCLDPNITGFTTYTWVEVEASRASPAHDAGTLPDLVIPRMVGTEMRRE
jgi:hypothetical protein